MPKLRNGNTDTEKFADWMGRKCRNHNPLEELKLPSRERASLPRMHSPKKRGEVFLVKNDRNRMIYMAAGRAFEINVTEVDPETVAPSDLVPVGL